MARIPAANRDRGRAAEAAFKAWLVDSRLAFMVVDQTPLTMPRHLSGSVKRPDYLVGILSIGLVAVDVKARTPVEGHLLIDADEHAAFGLFERYFGTPVWYACYTEGHARSCCLFRNVDICPERDGRRLGGRTAYAVPIELATHCRVEAEPFDAALFNASRERSG